MTASANVKNPQTFNRYSYVLNSPYKYTDPLGLIGCSASESRCSNENDSSWLAFEESSAGPAERPSQQIASPPAQQQGAATASDPPVPMTDDVRARVTASEESWLGFTIVNRGSRGEIYVGQASTDLTAPMTETLGTQGDIFFDRGIQEAGLFRAAITAMKGAIVNIRAQGDEAAHITMIALLQKQINSASLGNPIIDINGQGIGIGSVSLSNQRAVVDAVTAYNSYLAATDAKRDYESARFSRDFAHVAFSTKTARGNSLKLPLTTSTLQGIFSRRMNIARNAGQKYLK